MKNILLILFPIFLMNCTRQQVENQSYILHPAVSQKAVLVLFPCIPCDKEHTVAEADFLRDMDEIGITTILLDYNQKLFLSESEKLELSQFLNQIFDENKIEKQNIFMGGFSSGGNLAAMVTNYLLETRNEIQPKGVFIVDAPFDLEQLYNGAKKDLIQNVDVDAVEEAKSLVEFLEKELGNPAQKIENYMKNSPYLISKNAAQNISQLTKIKTRFYCEPALDWQAENRNRVYEDLNAFKLEKAYESLLELGGKNVEFIETENRGIRANGQRHPHSWNIVARENLVNWILN